MVNGSLLFNKAKNWKINVPISINFTYWFKEILRIFPNITLDNRNMVSELSEKSQIDKREEDESILSFPSDFTFLFGSCEIMDDEPMFV